MFRPGRSSHGLRNYRDLQAQRHSISEHVQLAVTVESCKNQCCKNNCNKSCKLNRTQPEPKHETHVKSLRGQQPGEKTQRRPGVLAVTGSDHLSKCLQCFGCDSANKNKSSSLPSAGLSSLASWPLLFKYNPPSTRPRSGACLAAPFRNDWTGFSPGNHIRVHSNDSADQTNVRLSCIWQRQHPRANTKSKPDLLLCRTNRCKTELSCIWQRSSSRQRASAITAPVLDLSLRSRNQIYDQTTIARCCNKTLAVHNAARRPDSKSSLCMAWCIGHRVVLHSRLSRFHVQTWLRIEVQESNDKANAEFSSICTGVKRSSAGSEWT